MGLKIFTQQLNGMWTRFFITLKKKIYMYWNISRRFPSDFPFNSVLRSFDYKSNNSSRLTYYKIYIYYNKVLFKFTPHQIFHN